MLWMYLLVLIFSLLTLYFVHDEYKKSRFPKKAFSLVLVLEAAVCILSVILILQSLI